MFPSVASTYASRYSSKMGGGAGGGTLLVWKLWINLVSAATRNATVETFTFQYRVLLWGTGFRMEWNQLKLGKRLIWLREETKAASTPQI